MSICSFREFGGFVEPFFLFFFYSNQYFLFLFLYTMYSNTIYSQLKTGEGKTKKHKKIFLSQSLWYSFGCDAALAPRKETLPWAVNNTTTTTTTTTPPSPPSSSSSPPPQRLFPPLCVVYRFGRRWSRRDPAMRTRKGVQLFKRARYFFTYLFSFPFLFFYFLPHFHFYSTWMSYTWNFIFVFIFNSQVKTLWSVEIQAVENNKWL